MNTYFVQFTNFGYVSQESFPTMEKALEYAKSKCFDAAILHAPTGNPYKGSVIVATWGVFCGTKTYEV
jgi:hypothetical protein